MSAAVGLMAAFGIALIVYWRDLTIAVYHYPRLLRAAKNAVEAFHHPSNSYSEMSGAARRALILHLDRCPPLVKQRMKGSKVVDVISRWSLYATIVLVSALFIAGGLSTVADWIDRAAVAWLTWRFGD